MTIDSTFLDKFCSEIIEKTKAYQEDETFKQKALDFILELANFKYAYNFFWLGIPIIQIPQDLQALQEIIWKTKPDLIIETGIAWGGSLMFNASMLTILEACGEIENGQVVGIDIDIRPHNKEAILAHPMSKKITLLEGSSTDENIIKKIHELAKGKKVMVCLDSNHTHEHVLSELQAYAPLVSKGCYCVVCDTVVEDLCKEKEVVISDRPWGKGNNPKTAIFEYLKLIQENKSIAFDGEPINFEIDKTIETKIMLTCSYDGYLKRI